MQHVKESDIRHYFEGYGTIESIEIPKDHVTMRPKGYALIEFERSSEAKEAVKILDGFEIDGKKISVSIYNDYVQKQLYQKESKKPGENIEETGASYIHTAQARTLLMQKLMQGRDMGDMGMKPSTH